MRLEMILITKGVETSSREQRWKIAYEFVHKGPPEDVYWAAFLGNSFISHEATRQGVELSFILHSNLDQISQSLVFASL